MNTLAYAGLFLAILPSCAILAQTTPHPALVTNSTVVQHWNNGSSAIDTLVNVAIANRLPLGLIIEGQALCKFRIYGKPGSSVAELITSIEENVPGYTGTTRDGVLLITPKALSLETKKSLEVKLPKFGIEQPEGMQSLSVTLWFYIRGTLVPNQSSAFSGGIQDDGNLLPAFHMQNVTIEEILNYLVTKNAGGLWAMFQVPDGWIANPATIPYQVVSYSGNPASAARLTCPAP